MSSTQPIQRTDEVRRTARRVDVRNATTRAKHHNDDERHVQRSDERREGRGRHIDRYA